MYTYLLSFVAHNDNHQQFSNGSFTWPRPITSINQIRELEGSLRARHHADSVVLLGLSLLSGPEDNR